MSRLNKYRRGSAMFGGFLIVSIFALLIGGSVVGRSSSVGASEERFADRAEVRNLQEGRPQFDVAERQHEPRLTTAGRWTEDFLFLLLFSFPLFVLSLMFLMRLPGSLDVQATDLALPGELVTLIEETQALGFRETLRFTSTAGFSVLFRHDSFATEALISRLSNGHAYLEFVDSYEEGREILSNNASIPPGIFVQKPGVAVRWFPHLREAARLLEVHHRLALDAAPAAPSVAPLSAIANELAASYERQIKAGYLCRRGDQLAPTFSGALRYAALMAPPYGWIRRLYLRGAAHCLEYDLRLSPQSRPIPK